MAGDLGDKSNPDCSALDWWEQNGQGLKFLGGKMIHDLMAGNLAWLSIFPIVIGIAWAISTYQNHQGDKEIMRARETEAYKASERAYEETMRQIRESKVRDIEDELQADS